MTTLGQPHEKKKTPRYNDAFHSRLEDKVEELEEQCEEEESGGGGEAVDEAEVVHVVAVLGVDLQGRQEPETNRDKIRLRPIQKYFGTQLLYQIQSSCIKFYLRTVSLLCLRHGYFCKN